MKDKTEIVINGLIDLLQFEANYLLLLDRLIHSCQNDFEIDQKVKANEIMQSINHRFNTLLHITAKRLGKEQAQKLMRI
ncbi:MAG: hypothetical protein NW207_04730 [Cytophagales bacterium]|nr:hypothetical protein [Cytophagales bacterium]